MNTYISYSFKAIAAGDLTGKSHTANCQNLISGSLLYTF